VKNRTYFETTNFETSFFLLLKVFSGVSRKSKAKFKPEEKKKEAKEGGS